MQYAEPLEQAIRHCQLVQVFLVDARRQRSHSQMVLSVWPSLRAGCPRSCSPRPTFRLHQSDRRSVDSFPGQQHGDVLIIRQLHELQFVEAEVECSLHALAVR